MTQRLYSHISSLIPRRVLWHTQQLMLQGGFEALSARQFIGFSIFFSFSLAIITFFLTPFLTPYTLLHWLTPIAVLLFSLFGFYLILLLTAESRANKIEALLPDALQIISANIRAGMTLENAIWTSARPEFGPLRDEIKRVSADTFGGTPISITLSRMTQRVRSSILSRSVRLIVEGIRLGGQMAHLLEEVAQDIRGTQILRKEIATSTLTYAIFIVFAAMLAAPLLFSISTFYAEMNASVLQSRIQATGPDISSAARQAGVGAIASIGLQPQRASADGVTPTDVFWFSLACIFITNLFAALILGQVHSGRWSQGLKFIPVFAVIALSVYLLSLNMLRVSLRTLLR